LPRDVLGDFDFALCELIDHFSAPFLVLIAGLTLLRAELGTAAIIVE
jgi:hypothetical protein